MKTKVWIAGLVALLVFPMVADVAHADGIIIPIPPPHVVEPVDLAVKYHRVSVVIRDQVATTEVDQVFVNESSYQLEGTYIFPLPEEATISDFAMFVEGKRLSGQMLSAEEARRIYEDIVRSRRDPALLEYVGRNAFRATIFPIEPHGEKRVQLRYSQVLLANKGLIKYVYPLNTERFSSKPLEDVAITVEITSREPIKSIYSPSHNVAIERQDDYHATVSFEATDIKPDTDFTLYYTVSEEDLGLNLLSYKDEGEDGFFLLLVAPSVEVDESQVVAKDVFLVLDTSGSMEGEKIEQAKEALYFVLDHLNEDDRFNVIAYNTGVTRYAPGLRPASEARQARDFVRQLEAGGGTNIHRAFMETLRMTSRDRPQVIIFLTDGLPTAGITDEEQIIADVAREAPESVRIYAFGVGYDVNTWLLDTITSEHRGATGYVEPGQSIEEEVSAFYAKVSAPLLSDIELLVDGVTVDDIYPYPLPDLFAGSQLVVAGRYRQGGPATITLRGNLNDQIKEYRYEAYFIKNGGDDFIPRLWATRKIGYLLREIRLHGPEKELIDQIVSLGVRYGIMTPYTSFLIDDRQDILTDQGRAFIGQGYAAAPAPTAGPDAVAASKAQAELGSAEVVGGGESESAQVKHVRDKAFVLRDGIWTDTAYNPDRMKPRTVVFSSDLYFDLLRANPRWGVYFAVGTEVIVVLDGQAYRITRSGAADSPAVTPKAPRIEPPEDYGFIGYIWEILFGHMRKE
ncbi:MAG: VWA domain-containing protein [Chloroflexi bacterium]|nr:VWA domain-containing protein [Chloroflexota bacterium]